MALLKTSAIVLKSRKWGDADRIVTFFTLKYGKLRGVARGARRMKSRFGSALEPFVYADLNLYEKHGDSLYRVSQADIRESFHTLRDSLETITAAAGLTNLVGAVTADGDAVPSVFHALLEGLRAVTQGQDPAHTAAIYEMEILRFAGYLPHLDRCNTCQSQISAVRCYFSPRAGGTICAACARQEPVHCPILSPACLAFFRHALRIDLPLVSRLRPSMQVRHELREVIDLYVEWVAGRRLPKAHVLLGTGRTLTGMRPGQIAAEAQAAYERRPRAL